MTANISAAVKLSAAVVIHLCLSLVLFSALSVLQQLYPTVSLRYHGGLTAEQVESVNGLLTSELGFSPTVWGEASRVIVTSELRSCQATAIEFFGEGAVAYPAAFLQGSYPSIADQVGCAVSSDLAWNLWGSLDVGDLRLTYAGRDYLVRGVLQADRPLLLIAADDVSGCGCVALELPGAGLEDAYTQALQYTELAGLERPDAVLDGPALSSLLRCLAWLPLVLPALVCLFRLRVISCLRSAFAAYPWRYGVWLLIVLGLPWLLRRLPVCFIPTRWSDFSFWASLWQDMHIRIAEHFALAPRARDVVAMYVGGRALLALFGFTAFWAYLIGRLRQGAR